MPKTPAVARQGRRDPAATRQSLLEASIVEFADKGFAGARVDEIARRAGVNKQLVYHYFGGKEELYVASLEEVYGRIRESEKALRLQHQEPREAMATLVGFSFDYLDEHPEFIALLNDENRMNATHVSHSAQLVEMNSPLVRLIEETLERGVRAGVFNDRFGPVNLYMSIAGLSYFFFSNNRTLSAIFDRDMASPGQKARRRKHVIDLVLSALRPDDKNQPVG